MFVSIITVTYNAAQWMERTMTSVLNQTCKDYEYIVIDGASTDNTMQVVRRYEPLFEGRMRYISEPDNGLYFAMNKGIVMAKGDFLWFMNAGDEVYADTTLQQVKEAFALSPDKDKANIIYGKALTADASGKTTGEYHKQAPDKLTEKSLLDGLVVCHQAMLVRRSVAPMYNTDYHIAADYDWVIRLTRISEMNIYTGSYLCRFLADGLSQRNYRRSWKERFTVMRRQFGLIPALFAHLSISIKYIMKTILLFILLSCTSILYAQQTYSYVQRDSILCLDVYQPTAQPNGYTIVHIYGGGFIFGSRTGEWDVAFCRQLADNGYTAVAIDYRLGLRGVKNIGMGSIQALENAFYMAAEDCSDAVRFLVDNANDLGIQVDKIILEGSSAGAITALMTDFGRCNGLPFAASLPDEWQPAGIIAYSGAVYSKSGSLRWNKQPAPTLLFHGMNDMLVTYKQIVLGKRGLYGANSIVKQFDKYNYPYCIYRYKGLGHEVCMAGPLTIDALNLFVKEYIIEHRPIFRDAVVRDAAVGPNKLTNLSVKDLNKIK